MKKRFLLAILACLVSVLMLATTACSSGSKDSGTNAPAAQTAAPAPAADAPAAPAEPAAPVAADDSIIPEKTVTLDVYSQLANYSGEQVGWFAKVMLDKFNVKLNIIPQSEGVFATRMESGSLGDIVVFGHDGDEYTQAIQGGMLFDWESEDLLNDYGQYIQANMQKALEKNRVVSGDGHIYGFGHNVGTSLTEHEAFFYYPDIRWDLYKELGYPEIKTLEDYVGVLEGMQKLAPTSDTGGKTYGVSLFPDWDGDMVMFVKATAALYGWDEFGFGLYNPVTQEYQDCLQLDGLYLRALKFYNTLYLKGLLNPDSMTQTFNDVTEDFQTGAAFFQLFNWLGSS
ncbi:MAG: extracellular solute-binding protein, partial [Clostridiales bacterium]|nr:extracellular solute-binding protein [Clostridiales bacterium]